MPLGIVSDDDFLKELENNHASFERGGVVIGVPKPGRKEGDVNVPDSLRKIIGDTVIEEGRQEAIALASAFDVSPSSVSAYTAGKTSTASKQVDSDLSLFLRNRKDRISKKASRTILKAIDSITTEKLESANAVALAGVAKSLSGVIRDLQPEDDTKKEESVKFIVYAPHITQENNFETVELKE